MLQKLRPPPRPCPFLDKDVGEMAAVVSCSRGHSAGRRFLSRGLDSSNRTLELYRPAGNLFPRRAFACPRFQISSSGRVLGHPRVVNCSSSRCFADPGIEEGVLLPASEPNVPVAVQAIKSGKVIAVPTDTIYGFACDACSAEAIRRIYEIKGRQATKPLAVCVAEVSDIPRFARTEHLPPGLLDCLLPGPVTVILGRGESSALEGSLNPGVDSIGVRVPDCEFIRSVARGAGGALALTSANPSGQPSSVRVQDFAELWRHCAFVYDGGELPSGRAGSTVVDLTVAGEFTVVRPGSAREETVDVLRKFCLAEARS